MAYRIGRYTAMAILISLCFQFSGAEKSLKPGTVYIVLAVDTEPARIDPWTYSQTLDFSCFDNSSDNPQIPRVMNSSWRHQYRDAEGRPPRFTWFIMSHEALRHAINTDDLAVYDTLMKFREDMQSFADEIAWHYHHADWTDFDGDGRSAWNQLTTFDRTPYFDGTDKEIAESQLNDLLLRRNFFPTSFRAGWVWENNDFSRWLEGIIPFDYSAYPPNKNQAANHEPLRNIYDWSRAPRTYSGYHPYDRDYQKTGRMHRWIFRSLAPNNRKEWEKILLAAVAGPDQIFCYTGHSYDNLRKDIDNFLPELLRLGDSLQVKLVFATATEAGAAIAGHPTKSPLQLDIEVVHDTLLIRADQPLFQQTPYCVLVDASGLGTRVYPRPDGDQLWRFDISGRKGIEFICAGCDNCGRKALFRYSN
jgi:hypothetical protein